MSRRHPRHTDDPTARAPRRGAAARRVPARTGAWAPRPSRSSTGWPTRGSRGGRCCRSPRPTATARPTRARRPSRAGRACWRPRRGRGRAPRRSPTSASATATGSTTGPAPPGPGALEDQVRFDREWGALRGHAADRGVRIMGDMPFYVAPRGADVARPSRPLPRPTSSPGCRRTRSPPTASSGATRPTTGRRCARDGLPLVDRAPAPLAATCTTPSGSTTSGPSWPGGACPAARRTARGRAAGCAGPGGAVIEAAPGAARRRCRWWPRTSASSPRRSTRLMARLGLPGMRVIQFAFAGQPGQRPPPREPPRARVVYAGTHDNDTAARLVGRRPPEARATGGHGRGRRGAASRASPRTGCSCAWRSPRRRASRSCTAQDLLGLGVRGPAQHPGHASTATGRGACAAGQLTADHAAWLREETEAAGRLPASHSGRGRAGGAHRARHADQQAAGCRGGCASSRGRPAPGTSSPSSGGPCPTSRWRAGIPVRRCGGVRRRRGGRPRARRARRRTRSCRAPRPPRGPPAPGHQSATSRQRCGR